MGVFVGVGGLAVLVGGTTTIAVVGVGVDIIEKRFVLTASQTSNEPRTPSHAMSANNEIEPNTLVFRKLLNAVAIEGANLGWGDGAITVVSSATGSVGSS